MSRIIQGGPKIGDRPEIGISTGVASRSSYPWALVLMAQMVAVIRLGQHQIRHHMESRALVIARRSCFTCI